MVLCLLHAVEALFILSIVNVRLLYMMLVWPPRSVPVYKCSVTTVNSCYVSEAAVYLHYCCIGDPRLAAYIVKAYWRQLSIKLNCSLLIH